MFKKILGISICMICLGLSNVSAEVITVEGDGECEFGSGTKMTVDDAIASAREYALRDASQKVAVHVKSISKSVDHMITEDKIELISSNILSVPKEEFIFGTIDNKVFVMKCRIVANVDDDNILKQIRQNDAELDAALKRIKELEAENRKLRMKDLPRKIILEGTGELVIGENFRGDLNLAKERAKEDALKSARMQSLGKSRELVQSIATTRDIVVTNDEIYTIIANIIKIQGEPEYMFEPIYDGAGIVITCKLQAKIDVSDLLDELNKLK